MSHIPNPNDPTPVLAIRPCVCSPNCQDVRFGILNFQICEEDNAAFCVIPHDKIPVLIVNLYRMHQEMK